MEGSCNSAELRDINTHKDVEAILPSPLGWDEHHIQLVVLRKLPHHGHQVQVAGGNIDCQNAIGGKVLQVYIKGFSGGQVKRYGITTEDVQGQQVEFVRAMHSQLFLHREARISQYHHLTCRAIGQVAEISTQSLSQIHHDQIDLVKGGNHTPAGHKRPLYRCPTQG